MDLQRGTEVMIYSRSQKKLCPARIIGLEGEFTTNSKVKPKTKKIPKDCVEIKYTEPCGNHVKVVRISEIRYNPSSLHSPPGEEAVRRVQRDSRNPCVGVRDGTRHPGCPLEKPICMKNKCSERTVESARERRMRERMMRERAAIVSIDEGEEEEEEEEDMEPEPEGQSEEERRMEDAKEAFKRAMNLFFLTRTTDDGELTSVEREYLDRYSARDVAAENEKALSIYNNSYGESPWGRALFDRMWEEEVSRRIGERHAGDAPDEPGMGGGFRRKNRKSKKRKTRKKRKSKKRKPRSRKSKTKRRR